MGKPNQQNIMEMPCHCRFFPWFWGFHGNHHSFHSFSIWLQQKLYSVLSTRQLETRMDQDTSPGFLQPNLLFKTFEKARTGGTSCFQTHPLSQHLQFKSAFLILLKLFVGPSACKTRRSISFFFKINWRTVSTEKHETQLPTSQKTNISCHVFRM